MAGSRRHPDVPSPSANEPLILLKENQFAHAAVSRLAAAGAGGDAAWIVFLYGPPGVGKSHFVRHFVRDARRHLPRLRIQSSTTSEFVARLSEAFLREEQAEFQAQYAAADILVLEDISSIQGRTAAQRMLTVILDELKRAGGRVIVTGASLPGALKSVLPRLTSRLRSGLCVPIELLGETSRHNFAQHLAASRQIPLSPQAAEILAKEGPTTPREILAALINLDMRCRRNGDEGDVSLVRAQLKATKTPEARSLPRIGGAVGKFFKVPIAELRSTRRQKKSVLARQVAMLLARELSGEPAAVIARFFGRKNHTTVVHACRRTRTLLERDPALARDVDRLRRALRKP